MISKNKIQDIASWYDRNSWILHLPFMIYFAFSLINIGKMKSEISKIEMEVDKHVEENRINMQESYSDLFFYIERRPKFNKFYEDIKVPFDFVQGNAFLTSEYFEGELDLFEQHFREILDYKSEVFKFDPFLKQKATEYPIIKKYISSKYASQMIDILYTQISLSAGCYFNCRYFSPVVQKNGSKYFIYPNVALGSSLDFPKITVNGETVTDSKYEFKPKKKGVHFLDIEFSYIYELKKETIFYRKQMLVK